MTGTDPILPLLFGTPDTAVFAVVDGAQMDALPVLLSRLGLAARPLYFEVGNGRGHAAGPHLVACPEAQAGADLRAQLPATAVVWWVWPERRDASAQTEIFRHLRGLGRVEIPAGHPGPTPPGVSHEPVLFRHADPRVLAEVLPVLDPAQQEKLSATIPIGRMGDSADIAAAVVYLASNEAGYVTGQTLHVNGGMAMI